MQLGSLQEINWGKLLLTAVFLIFKKKVKKRLLKLLSWQLTGKSPTLSVTWPQISTSSITNFNH